MSGAGPDIAISSRGDPGAALFTDQYELTMAAAYLAEGRTGTACFELFFRRMPQTRSYAVAAGLDDVLAYLENFRFTAAEIEYLRSLSLFDEKFLSALAEIRFTGDVNAMPEGTLVFENEPILQVIAPIVEAQLVETMLLNQVHLQTVLASKAARVVEAAQGRQVVDFGARRAHGIDAALKVARCSYLAGAAGSSLLQAGQRYGIPTFGTMAHSYVQAHEEERAAFGMFARLYAGTTLLVDTWDTIEGVENAVQLLRGEPALAGRVAAIRIDSGDLGDLARRARQILDAAGLEKVRIVASSDLDEWSIARLVEQQAPIDGFGVGTRMATSPDAPSLDIAYKLVEYAGRGTTKLSTAKALYPFRKQVFRGEDGDTIGRWDERLAGQPLLVPMMRGGRRLPAGMESLAVIRRRVAQELSALPPALRSVERKASRQISWSPALEGDLQRLRAEHAARRAAPADPGQGPGASPGALQEFE